MKNKILLVNVILSTIVFMIRMFSFSFLSYISNPIIGATLFILLVFVILNMYDKLHYLKLHVKMSIFDYFIIFGLCLADIIVTGIGYGVIVGTFVLNTILMILSIVGIVINATKLSKTPKYVETSLEKEQLEQERSKAIIRLKDLKALLDCGLISEEEHDRISKKYIDLL